MTSSNAPAVARNPRRVLQNKVPEVTVYFWVIKVLCTTVGETAADFLNVNLNLGLTGTSVVTGVLTAVALAVQFASDRYRPARYWLTVALVSVFGTLVTDNLSDQGVPLETSTVVFAVLLAATFLAWYLSERTLSIHTIVTRRREAFYWSAIVFTFALGTATGDLMAEVLGLGYATTGGIVAGVIVVSTVAWRVGLHPVLAFWVVYILTRPLGASIGDYLSQPASVGGLDLGPTTTSVLFTAAIIATVLYLVITKADVTAARDDRPGQDVPHRGGLAQTAVVVVVLLAAGITGYQLRTSALQRQDQQSQQQGTGAAPGAPRSPLGDLSAFRGIAQSTLDLLNAGRQSDATSRVDDLEAQWDAGEARLKPRDPAAWSDLDGKIDTVLRELRSTSPNATTEKAALSTLITATG